MISIVCLLRMLPFCVFLLGVLGTSLYRETGCTGIRCCEALHERQDAEMLDDMK